MQNEGHYHKVKVWRVLNVDSSHRAAILLYLYHSSWGETPISHASAADNYTFAIGLDRTPFLSFSRDESYGYVPIKSLGFSDKCTQVNIMWRSGKQAKFFKGGNGQKLTKLNKFCQKIKLGFHEVGKYVLFQARFSFAISFC